MQKIDRFTAHNLHVGLLSLYTLVTTSFVFANNLDPDQRASNSPFGQGPDYLLVYLLAKAMSIKK